jgi:hypothetical protein
MIRRLVAVLIAVATILAVPMLGSSAVASTPPTTAAYGYDAATATPALEGGDATAHQVAPEIERVALSAGDLSLARQVVVAAEDAAGGSSRLVIGRTSDLQAPEAMGAGEYNLLDQLPNQGSPQANWVQNSTVLRQALRNGVTQIRDVSPGDTGGQFLNAERNLLENRGWTFDPTTNMWNAP